MWESLYIHPVEQFFSLSVLGKSNMGGSPKPAVDSIKEILNINQKRNDYLGEHLPLLPSVLPLQGAQSLQPGVPASWLSFQRDTPPQAVSFCMKTAKCHCEESGVEPPVVSTVVSSFIGCGHGSFFTWEGWIVLGPASQTDRSRYSDIAWHRETQYVLAAAIINTITIIHHLMFQEPLQEAKACIACGDCPCQFPLSHTDN